MEEKQENSRTDFTLRERAEITASRLGWLYYTPFGGQRQGRYGINRQGLLALAERKRFSFDFFGTLLGELAHKHGLLMTIPPREEFIDDDFLYVVSADLVESWPQFNLEKFSSDVIGEDWAKLHKNAKGDKEYIRNCIAAVNINRLFHELAADFPAAEYGICITQDMLRALRKIPGENSSIRSPIATIDEVLEINEIIGGNHQCWKNKPVQSKYCLTSISSQDDFIIGLIPFHQTKAWRKADSAAIEFTLEVGEESEYQSSLKMPQTKENYSEILYHATREKLSK